MKTTLVLFIMISAFCAKAQVVYVPGTIGSNSTNNNISIGAGAAPAYKLDVQSTTDDNKQFRIKSPGSPLMKFSGSYNGGDGAEIWQQSSGNFLINVNSSLNAFTISPTGNVGIGLYDPAYKLVVQGEVHINRNYPYLQLNSSYWSASSFIQNGVTHAGPAVEITSYSTILQQRLSTSSREIMMH